MRAFVAICTLSLIAMADPSLAVEVAGVSMPDKATLADGSPLVLNGAGVRKKFFVSVYAGGLYVAKRSDDVEEIFADPGGKRVLMHFLYKEVDKEKLTQGWDTGFEKNLSDEDFAPLKDRLGQFNKLFVTVHKGDVIRLDYLPKQGTQVWINDKLKGTVKGEDFARGLLKVWLGKKPADKGLKKSMLGKN